MCARDLWRRRELDRLQQRDARVELEGVACGWEKGHEIMSEIIAADHSMGSREYLTSTEVDHGGP